jgi:NAD-dependent DNA ligase
MTEYHIRNVYSNTIYEREYYRQQVVADSVISQLLGICKGLVCDGVVNLEEARFLFKWFESNKDLAHVFPGRELFCRLERIFADGIVSEEEREELKLLLLSVTGQTAEQPDDTTTKTTRALFEDPEPTVLFPGRSFCFTGTFVTGKRIWCAEQVIKRSAQFHEAVTLETSYLVLGREATKAWAYPNFGRKIEKAIEYKQRTGLKIVSEAHWAAALKLNPV